MIKKRYKSVGCFDANGPKHWLELGSVGAVINNPDVVTEEYLNSFESRRNWLEFGLFGNTPQYHGGVTADEIVPKPEDFIEKPFRLLSATVVGGGTWKATDFSKSSVLKRSRGMLEGKPLYKDHETDLDNWVGLVKSVRWTNSQTLDGLTIPGGIDGIVAIDAKTNPKVARGVLMGSIFSNSVTVEFEWEMSHTFESEWTFYERVGTMHEDGTMVRRVVTTIVNYHESSLVWLGADPFAKALDESGNPVHVDVGSVYGYSKSKDKKMSDGDKELLKTGKKFELGFGISENVLYLSHSKSGDTRPAPVFKDKDKDLIDMDKKFLAAFVAKFGDYFKLEKGATPSVDDMLSYLDDLSIEDNEAIEFSNAVKPMVESVMGDGYSLESFTRSYSMVSTEDLDGLKTKAESVDTLETEVESLRASAATGEKYLKLKRGEAISLYKKAMGDKASDAVVSLFEAADDDAIDGLLNQYAKEATARFTGKCADCGSGNFSFQSSFSKDSEESGEDKGTIVTFDSMFENVKGMGSTL